MTFTGNSILWNVCMQEENIYSLSNCLVPEVHIPYSDKLIKYIYIMPIYAHLFNLRPNIYKSWCLSRHFIPNNIDLTLSILNLLLSSSSTTSRELLPQFSTCSGWKWRCGLNIKKNCHVLANQFHGNFRSKTLGCRKIKYVSGI